MRSYLIFALLFTVKTASRLLFRVRLRWLSPPPGHPWPEPRILALLNHTSLFEPIFAAAAPNALLWRIARHGVIPVADKTVARPWVGRFFRLVAHQVVPITRERDHTWADVVSRVEDPDAMVIILPEGRMKRRTGLDAHGNEMTVRGGIADLIETTRSGPMLLGYSPGLHHIHAPGDRWPRLFQSVDLGIEIVDIRAYREARMDEAGVGGFKRAVVEDLTRRRDDYLDQVSDWPTPADAQRNRTRSNSPVGPVA